MKKIIGIFILVAAIILIVLAATGVIGKGVNLNNTIKKDNKFKIGALLTLSGPGAFLGEEYKKGMKLANREVDLPLVIEDSETDPKKGVSAFKKLVNQNTIDAAVVTFSSVAGAVMPIADNKNIPVIQSLVSASNVAKDSNYAFRYFTSGGQEAPIMAEHVINNESVQTAAILYLEGEYGISYANAFQKTFEKNDANVVLTETFRRSEQDFRTQLTKIKSKNPDILYIVGLDSQLPSIFKQAEELNLKTKLATNWILASPQIREKVEPYVDKVFLTTPAYYFEEPSNVTEKFKKAYQKEYNSQPSAYAALGHDIVKIFGTIDKTASSNEIIEELRKIDSLKLAMGEVSVDTTGEIQFPLYPAVMRNGSMEVLAN